MQNNSYNTWSINMIILPNISSTHSRQSVRWTGSTAWIELSPNIRHLHQSQAAFKYKLKKFLIESAQWAEWINWCQWEPFVSAVPSIAVFPGIFRDLVFRELFFVYYLRLFVYHLCLCLLFVSLCLLFVSLLFTISVFFVYYFCLFCLLFVSFLFTICASLFTICVYFVLLFASILFTIWVFVYYLSLCLLFVSLCFLCMSLYESIH